MRYQRGLLREAADRTGVLLVNLGTPEAPTVSAVRRYLGEFLHDHRVVELTRWIWCLILHGIILRTRPRRSAAAYTKIWSETGSPLMSLMSTLAERLDTHFKQHCGSNTCVAMAMRYGQPSVKQSLQSLADSGMTRMVVVPLYPQYSCSTTASVYDAVGETLRGWRNLPAVHIVRDYHLAEGYLDALTASVQEHWDRHARAEKLVISFHGTPQRYADQGDPYHLQCERTATALAQRLGLTPEHWVLSFQSRVGRAPWLRPYTDETLRSLAQQGTRHVDLICPGFAVDCLETLEEIAKENADIFREAGGQGFAYISCLNDRTDHVKALAEVIRVEAPNWFPENTGLPAGS
ncbi:MAG TPA: ferrochelatase [Gammaproteobacteria bacterium]|nr:ferrochelatase [Gammaproteobacteria bacterium]